jgi:glyoxylase-like metal-dependent hydrolase (beta-lactamase superfamily II)
VAATGASAIPQFDDAPAIPVPTDEPVRSGDLVLVGEVGLEVVHLVGQTLGSIALLYDDPPVLRTAEPATLSSAEASVA